jgi:hypothetical protein
MVGAPQNEGEGKEEAATVELGFCQSSMAAKLRRNPRVAATRQWAVMDKEEEE